MPCKNTESSHPIAFKIQPATPAKVLCAPSEAPAPGYADAAATVGVGRANAAALSRRADKPPLRSLDEIMRAFREERRLTQEEGQAGAVILQIIARTGRGSLLGDLCREDGA